MADRLDEATSELGLNEQERALYERHLKNLHGPGGVDNKDGTRSTLYATTVGVDDKTYVIPTVYDGKKLSEKEAIKRAEAVGFDKFPSYGSPEDAKARYDAMHDMMEQDTAAALRKRNPPQTILSPPPPTMADPY